jgi:hypothetical protein
MGPFRVYGSLQSVWVPLYCMGPFRVCGPLQSVWVPLYCMGPFRVCGPLQSVWVPLQCMGPFRLYGSLQMVCVPLQCMVPFKTWWRNSAAKHNIEVMYSSSKQNVVVFLAVPCGEVRNGFERIAVCGILRHAEVCRTRTEWTNFSESSPGRECISGPFGTKFNCVSCRRLKSS